MMHRFKTLKDHVYDYIAEQILLGKLQPEEKINENAVCKELSISRTPVREALIQLSSEGILDNVPRKGFVVKNMTEKEAQELYTIIGHLDGLSAALACPSLTDKEFTDMEFYIDSMELAINVRNYGMYLTQQKAFHQIYIDKCGNDTLIEYIERLKNKFLKRVYIDDPMGKTAEILKDTNAEHRELLRLLKEGKGSEASRYLSEIHWASKNAHFDLMTVNN
ncbi:MAG: GntR family transcriptional regulator [Anaerovoracaceae bacterium]